MAGRNGNARATLEARPPAHRIGVTAGASFSAIEIQIFGRRDSRATQNALRFFSERRVEVSFVDLAKRAIATGELRRFAHRFGALQLIDESAPAFKAAGLSYMRMDDDEAFDRVLARQSLLRLPLTRAGNRLTVGIDEDAWRSWLSEEPA